MSSSGDSRKSAALNKWRNAVHRIRKGLAITQNGEAGSNEPTRRAYDPATSALFNCDNEPIPTLDDVAGWGTSFENLMKCAAGRVLFREFLRFEYSEENVLFWAACEELKREVSPEAVEERARAIYEEYISVLSPKEVSLDSAVRDIVNKNMMQPTPHTYDEAQQQIYTLMQRDSYPRFVTSSIYKNLLEKTKLQHQEQTGTGNNQKQQTEPSPKDDTKMLSGHRSSS
ncbi:regulator of G-protein signaling rgs-2 isoform X2 [Ctenocephalides felis]|uniref:regulator of G-protein signaling rgs-2 isoform X2 n=1 Tax=Ctenocephalides felis TaxID=7515 RepID=UPI000E6E1960|nr:regulator of G-protein signaling rgs-2 isoform X2 [Ctenocephalides felis]